MLSEQEQGLVEKSVEGESESESESEGGKVK